MNEEITSSSQENTNPAGTIEHCYLEVGTDVLDKTNALTSILESNGGVPTLIFCNSKSDQEFVEVILRKRGISVQRISMDTSPAQKREITKQLKDYSFTNLIVNDHFGTDFNYNHKGLIVNYSIPEEPEVYLDRIGKHGSEVVPARVISLVSALDFGNFHYIKKIVENEFVKLEPPSKEQVFESKLAALVAQAKREDFKADATVETLVDMLEQHADRKQVLALLVHNTINLLPALKNQSPAPERRSERGGRRDERSSEGGERYGRGRDRRGGRGRRSEYSDYGDSDSGMAQASSSEEGSSEQEWDGERSSNGRRERFSLQPPVRDARFYIGHGSREGFSQTELERLVQEKAGLSSEQLKRVSIRDCYSFVDVAEEQAQQFQTALEDADLSSGKKIFLRKAALINVPREGGKTEESPLNGHAPTDEMAEVSEEALAAEPA